MKDRQFIINSIKMDLHRVVSSAGDISKPLPLQSVEEFLNHSIQDFSKIETDALQQTLKNKLIGLSKEIQHLRDPKKRLVWAEDILTIRCRLA